MWNKQSLKNIIKENFKDCQFVIVSNREPYIHIWKNDKIVCQRSIGGVTISFETIMRTTGGIWVAYGGSSADKDTVDENDHVKLPVNDPKYTLRRVWMSKKELAGYYEGFSNSTLWPLCHVVFIKPSFVESDWQNYKKINKRFAKAILEEIEHKKAIVWIQDYHFALLPRYIKEKRPDVIVAQFWHIPWPTHEIFRICPWKKEILDGLLHNDLLGFHRYYHVDNFFKTVNRELEANVDYEDLTVLYKKNIHKIKFFPISVDYEDVVNRLKNARRMKKFLIKELVKSPYKILAVGIDRIDYTKGIPLRLRAIEKFLEMYPKYRGKFVYLGIGAPSRTGIVTYRRLGREINEIIKKISQKFKKGNWQPIYYLNEVVERNKVLNILSQADLCLITSLDDGMNLVAKEFVAANETGGSLIISQFTGAAKELTEGFLINPYDIKSVAQTIYQAIKTPKKERIERMKKMKNTIKERNLYRWAGKFLLELSTLKGKTE